MEKKVVSLHTDRRRFLAGIAVGGAAALTSGKSAAAQAAAPPASTPTAADAARAAGREIAQSQATDMPVSDLVVKDPGSDYMVDCIKALDIEYVCVNPGGNIRGIHESIINYGGNKKPELITVTHEEAGAAFAHGYFKASGKPIACLLYGDIAIQHASMAVYNAYADRVPMILIAGNRVNAEMRGASPDWYHSGNDLARLLDGSIKWSDEPQTAVAFGESLHRGYRIATTQPYGPVMVTANAEIGESELPNRAQMPIPKYFPVKQASADPGALAEAARMLAAAEYPVIVACRCVDSQAGMDNLVKLAELLGAAVVNQRDRLCIPRGHPLNLTGADGAAIAKADVFLFLGADEIWTELNDMPNFAREPVRHARPDAKIITIGVSEYAARGNLQDQQRYYPTDLPITGSPEESIPYLIEALERVLDAPARAKIAARAKTIADGAPARDATMHRNAAVGWDASPISTARLSAELGALLRNEEWAIVSPTHFLSDWPLKLWKPSKYYQFRGTSGAGGEGYIAPAALGAAIHHAKQGRLSVSFQTDGDLMYLPGTFWTAAHHKIPLLSVMHNNRAYHAEYMNIQRMANLRQRGIRNTDIGTTLKNPDIDYATVVRGMGVWATGPITDPTELSAALKRAIEVVKAGEPALVDIHTQPR